jgi:hypothetical protein
MSDLNPDSLLAAALASVDGVAVPKHGFPLEDNRYDPLVGLALATLNLALRDRQEPLRPKSPVIIALTDSGCASHVQRVVQGVADMRPRQAFFARGGLGMLATYVSLALQVHGPCFTLSGGVDSVRSGMMMASRLMKKATCDGVVFVAADYADGGMLATVVSAGTDSADELLAMAGKMTYDTGVPAELLRTMFAVSMEETA